MKMIPEQSIALAGASTDTARIENATVVIVHAAITVMSRHRTTTGAVGKSIAIPGTAKGAIRASVPTDIGKACRGTRQNG